VTTTLPELVRPIFIFVVAFRRRARRGAPLQYGDVKREILALFARVEAQATAKSMTDRWSRIKTGLVYLVDEVAIMEDWGGQESWNNHSLEVELLGHDEKMRGAWFFDREYAHAIESGDAELTEVLYTCMALGFEGKFRDQTAQLKNHMENLYARLPIPYQPDEEEERMFPGCYYVDKTKNDPRVPMHVATVLIIFFGMLMGYFVVSWLAHGTFVEDLARIEQQVRAVQ